MPKDPRPWRSGTRLTHPDKVLFPNEGLTKEDLIVYYRAVADRMLPHVVGRPLMLLRCPEGVGEECFHQKHLVSRMPPSVHAAAIGNKEGGAERHLTIEDLAGLEGLVQSNVIEVHAWGARVDRIERPDRIAFDLDPGPGIGWPQVVRAAVEVRERLRADGLVSFVKTTGGKGLHVVVPIERRNEWADVKEYVHGIAGAMADDQPARYTATMSKQQRTDRIFIDYLRNARGATWIVPYSPRAHPGALVSMPLTWAQLEQGTTPESFGLPRLLRGLPVTPDPWAEMEETRQRLPVAQRPQRAASR
jgi:bifunctional non-homologous end joining protein LigD